MTASRSGESSTQEQRTERSNVHGVYQNQVRDGDTISLQRAQDVETTRSTRYHSLNSSPILGPIEEELQGDKVKMLFQVPCR